jgi:hypothetical protein
MIHAFQRSQNPTGRSETAAGSLQRKCACGGTPGPTGECEACRKKRLQRKAAQPSALDHQQSEVPPIVHEVLRSPGQPLDRETRAFVEPRFKHNFGEVRVHTDSKAVESARAVSALAYTVGQHIVFGADNGAPKSAAGRQLLVHELVHTLQDPPNVDMRKSDLASLQVADQNDRFEHEAEQLSKTTSSISETRTTDFCNLKLRRQIRRGPSSMATQMSNSCGQPEKSYKTSPHYCKDTKFTGKLHLGKRWKNHDGKEHEHPITRCYREVPERSGGECPPGKHVCFDDFGHCGDEHEDSIAPFSKGADAEGHCISTPWLCVLKHGAADLMHIDQGKIETPFDTPRSGDFF